jgi:hypothetical protein
VILISTSPEQALAELIEESLAIGFVSESDLSDRAIVGLVAARNAPVRTRAWALVRRPQAP